MSEVDTITLMWFQPWHYFLYLFVIFVGMVGFYQWHWAKTCKENIQILIIRTGGGGDYELAPKSSGGEISLTNPDSNTVRTWPINELTTVEIPYPGVGFIPNFLQKTIRLAIVSEWDWEPVLNRSPHKDKIASPDVVAFLQKLAEEMDDKDEKAKAIKAKINELVPNLATGPTREMIASPAVLGNLIHEKITEALITVNKEVFDKMAGLLNRLNKLVNPMIVYIGLGLMLFGVAYIIYQLAEISGVGGSADVLNKLDAIEKALGIK